MADDSQTRTAHSLVEPGQWGSERLRRSRPPVPALTVLYHPQASRVGERCLLSALSSQRSVRLARMEPFFSQPSVQPAGQPSRAPQRPLEDLYISRTPLRLLPQSGGWLRLEKGESRTPLEIDGVPVEHQVELSPAQLESGVILMLARRVVLVLHLYQPEDDPPPRHPALVGESSAMMQVRQDIQRVADLDVPVLVRGETGTGKELVARAIHDASQRRREPYLAVNIGAVPASLAASELFGAVKGAFTGSVKPSAGYFQRAEAGTLFLDEVGETPPEVQVALLRVLETGEIQRVGSAQAQKVNVRLLAATDADLEAAIESGGFKAPLLHRLCGFEIVLPPLRRRRDDFGRLFFHFLRRELREVGEEHRLEAELGGRDPWLPASLVAGLAMQGWPGNVRQLRNVVRQMVIGSRGGDRLMVGPQVERMLRSGNARGFSPPPRTSSEGAGAAGSVGAQDTPRPPSREDLREESREVPREPAAKSHRSPSDVGDEELVAALKAHRWKLKPTARALGLARSSLYMLVDRHPSIRKASELSREEIEACRQECGGDLEAMVDRLEVSAAGLRQRLRELNG
ncbi:MAG: sigma 54-interacting transcriptional regulator [Acidobacteriota bacterium]|nr:sigma 54-interacting transcriptional regulator [Acidobacteriota bacterium]